MIYFASFPPERFEQWYDNMLKDYARNRAKAGSWEYETAEERARELYKDLLPEGVNSPNHFIALLMNESDEEVGSVWYAPSIDGGVPHLYIYDLLVYEKFRRKGYGAQTLAMLEEYARVLGLERMVLHVFGHNDPARGLYEKYGFIETSVMMAKKIEP